MGTHSFFQYNLQKKELLKTLKEDSHVTILSLQKNLAHFIEAYALNDYEVLLENEMQHQHFSAIIVEDFNMAKIMGKKTYTTGRVRSDDGSYEDYNLDKHSGLVGECYYYESAEILSKSDQKIALVSICSNDFIMKQSLQKLLINNALVGLVFSFLLLVALFFIIRRFAILPITHFNDVLSQKDEDGIPTHKVEKSNIYEFEELSCTVNQMIEAVQEYRAKEKQNLISLNKERERFLLALPIGVLVYDVDLQSINYANDAAFKILNIENIVGTNLEAVPWNLVDEEETPFYEKWITLDKAQAKRHIVVGLQFENLTKWLSMNTEPFYVEEKFFGMIVSLMDITKERQLIQELDNERHRFKLAIEGTQDGLWDWNLKQNTVFFSTQWKKMLGYKEDEIGNELSEWSSRVHPDDLKSAMESVKEHLAGKTEVYENRHRMLAKDGTWKWILDRGKALFSANGEPLRVVGFHTDITKEVEHQKELEHSAKHDSLTHLPNRFLFNELIQSMLYRVVRNRKGLALIYIDLDGFKEVNDTFGHEAGDVVLVEVSRRMKELLRQEDILARLGGDEFVVALSDIAKSEDIIPLLERFLKVLNEPIHFQNAIMHLLQVSASIGVSTYPQEKELGPEALLRQADQAMYEAKNGGKNQYRFFNLKENESLKSHQEFLAEFSHAISAGELQLHYQPKVDMQKGLVLGAEALLRWNHPQKGLLYPDYFLPDVNDNAEIMLQLGRWVISSAIQQLSLWVSKGYKLSMNINISAHEFNDKSTIPFISSLLNTYTMIDPSQIELEILETNALKDIQMAHNVIKEFHALGLSIALDDFGTGYSTMSYLKELPVNTLKIDKSFVIEMLHNKGSYSILEAAIGLSHAFHCQTIAEGVESQEHGVKLIELGCKVGQGYVIAKPMPADSFELWFKEWRGFESWK